MWLIPTRNRPELMRALIVAMEATGEVPVCAVMQDDCEYDITWPSHWKIHKSDRHLEMAKAINGLFKLYPDEPFYGMLDDHTRPVSPGWSTALKAEAGSWGLASGWNLTNRFLGGRMRINCYAMGGDLARSLGWVWPDFVVHLYGDNVLEDLGYELGMLKFVRGAVFKSLLLRDGSLKPDGNSKRMWNGRNYPPDDRRTYEEWKALKFRTEVNRLRIDMEKKGH